jgi:hypothetical protein
MGIAYYIIALIVVRVNLVGRVEPGPITKPLQYRWILTYYLPFHLILHLVLAFGVYTDVPLNDASAFSFSLDHLCSTPAKTTHSIGCLLVLLVALPASFLRQRQQALQQGVLTPWQLASLFRVGGGLGDETFGDTARVAVGVHHLTTPAFFSSSERAAEPVTVTLPTELDPGSLYQPISFVDLDAGAPSLSADVSDESSVARGIRQVSAQFFGVTRRRQGS